MSKHMMDNFVVSDWYRLTSCAVFNNIPFGVYAITEPTDTIPPSGLAPHQYDRTVYVGKSGLSYDDFYYDRKHVKRKTAAVGEEVTTREQENFHRYGLPSRRLKSHRHNFINRNTGIDRETSYQKFFDKFGSGEDVIDKINVCIITPEYEIPNHSVRAWLSAMESYIILRYQYQFGRNTLMNIDHDLSPKQGIVEDCHFQRKKREVKSNSLMGLFENV